MITNARVLQPEFVPGDVAHRDAAVSHLSDILTRAVEQQGTETGFVYGPTGSGKTCISRFVVDQLHQNYIDVTSQYVNCWEDYTRFKALYRILEGIDCTLNIHRQSTPRDELLQRLRDYDGPPYIVILDEVDQLEDTDLLYDLYRNRSVSLILIANSEEEVFSVVDDRVHSRLQTCDRIRFDRYRLDELVTILEDRARMGLRPEAVDTDVLSEIADAAAGDARVAIGALRNAAKLADDRGEQTITRDLVSEAVPEAKAEITQTNLDRLTDDQRLLFDIITDAGTITPGDLYDRYESQADDPKTQRMVRNYLKKMARYDLIEAIGENRGRQYKAAQNG